MDPRDEHQIKVPEIDTTDRHQIWSPGMYPKKETPKMKPDMDPRIGPQR